MIRRGMSLQIALTAVIVIAAAVTGVRYTELTDDTDRISLSLLTMREIGRNTDSVQDAAHKLPETGDREQITEYREADAAVRKALTDAAPLLEADDRRRLAQIGVAYKSWEKDYAGRALRLAQAGQDAAALRLTLTEQFGAGSGKVFKQLQGLLDSVAAKEVAASDERTTTVTFGIVLFLIACLGLIISGIGMLVQLRRRTVHPLEQLADASSRLGAGELNARTEAAGVIEVATAGASFNTMAGALQRQVEELRELDELKTRFVSSVSHDLRSPLTSIKGFLELLSSGDAGELTDEQRRYVATAERGARELEQLVADLLTISRLEQGAIALRRAPVAVDELVREAVAELEPVARDREITIEFTGEPGTVADADDARLRQVFANLLSNAVKFSGPGSTIRVTVTRGADEVRVSVADQGVGIPAPELPLIGERFFRASSAKDVTGTGLGLAICKEILELHDGRLLVESEIGRGSTFTATLPAAGQAETQAGSTLPAGA